MSFWTGRTSIPGASSGIRWRASSFSIPAEGFPAAIEGRDSIVAGFRDLIGIYESYESELTGLYPAVDSDAVCVEYSVRAGMTGGGKYTNDNIAVFRFDAELIREYRDDFDPRRFQVVVDAMAKAD